MNSIADFRPREVLPPTAPPMPYIRPGVLERLNVRLVGVTDDFLGQASGALLSLAKET
ncbi:MAG: hypothetical protein LC797_10515 [Chloroflexi bacterium]|nr:hypothetical protein [Chloroflexota bacterium]